MGVHMEPLVFSMVQTLDGDADFPVAESARIDEVVKKWGSGVAAMLKQELAWRYVFLRILICILVVTWFVLAENLRLWQNPSFGLEHARMVSEVCASFFNRGSVWGEILKKFKIY